MNHMNTYVFLGDNQELEMISCGGQISSTVLRDKLVFFNQLQIFKKIMSKKKKQTIMNNK